MIAIIPARGGSKGVPRKNIRDLCGKPLMAYTIEAALNATSIVRVVVTTEDEEIADVAREYGAEVPFMRPKALAGDRSKAQDVYLHAVEYLKDHDGEDMSKFMVLLATTPFRTAFFIDDAVRVFQEERPETLISVKKVEAPPAWLLIRDTAGRVHNAGFDSEKASGNRQENRTYYMPNGAIYILDYRLLKEKMTYYSDNTIGYVMDQEASIDIDNMEEFEYAEYLMGRIKKWGQG